MYTLESLSPPRPAAHGQAAPGRGAQMHTDGWGCAPAAIWVGVLSIAWCGPPCPLRRGMGPLVKNKQELTLVGHLQLRTD
jgi:hypothetical protein